MVTRKGERGVALIVALVAVFVVTLSVLLIASLIQSRVNSFHVEERRVKLVTLSDGAMAETLARLHEYHGFRGIDSKPLGDGLISSKVTPISQSVKKITAVGQFQESQGIIEAEVIVYHNHFDVRSWTYRQSL